MGRAEHVCTHALMCVCMCVCVCVCVRGECQEEQMPNRRRAPRTPHHVPHHRVPGLLDVPGAVLLASDWPPPQEHVQVEARGAFLTLPDGSHSRSWAHLQLLELPPRTGSHRGPASLSRKAH